jgi:predicted metal-dependent phosphoesterase TrpH
MCGRGEKRLPTRTLRADDPIDLQLHTIYSDGHWQPEQLFSYLHGEGFRAVSITDHDTLDHVAKLGALGAAQGLIVIPGIEVTTAWRGLSAHLLCYAPRFEGKALAVLVRRTEREQLANTQVVYDELRQRGYTFQRQSDVLRQQGGRVRRPVDNAWLLEAHGYVETRAEGLAMIRDAGYRQILAPLEEAIASAHASGAVAVLAHPGRGGGEISRFDPPLLEELIQAVPLDGIEVWYPLHTEVQVAAYAAFAHEHHLLTSAGSDSHGPEQRPPVKYPAAQCAGLLERVGVTVMQS